MQVALALLILISILTFAAGLFSIVLPFRVFGIRTRWQAALLTIGSFVATVTATYNLEPILLPIGQGRPLAVLSSPSATARQSLVTAVECQPPSGQQHERDGDKPCPIIAHERHLPSGTP